MPAVVPATMAIQEVHQPPSQAGEAPKLKGGKGMGAGKGERLAPYEAQVKGASVAAKGRLHRAMCRMSPQTPTQNGCAQCAP